MPFDLSDLERRYSELELELRNPELIKNQRLYSASARKLSELSRVLAVWNNYKKTSQDFEGAKSLLDDQNLQIRQMAQSEIE
ncbi:MAG: PCRF domain-containing protein, partial [Deltaproteobacteria bacterium]|nr:PCRF domain-containing protein [Deltaproteobacteria bacterium]